MATFHPAPSANFISTTLNGAINDSVTTVTLNSVTNLSSSGGVLVIDREDGNDTATPTAREFISFTGISGSDLTGVTRAFDNSTARSHSDGALVEAVFSVGMWNDVRDAIATSMSTDGTGISVSTATVEDLFTSLNALVSTMTISGLINMSGASILGVDATPNDPLTQNSLAITSIASIARIEATNSVLNSTTSVAQMFYKSGKGTLTTDTDGATVTFDLDASNLHEVVLEDNRTLALSNDDKGQAFTLRLIQDGTGSRTVTWFTTIKWPGAQVPTLTTTGGKTDVFGFIVTGSGTYDGFTVGTNL